MIDLRAQAEACYIADGLHEVHPIGSREWSIYLLGFVAGKTRGMQRAARAIFGSGDVLIERAEDVGERFLRVKPSP